jgi:phosphate transport system permease protein
MPSSAATRKRVEAGLARRHRRERLFKFSGMLATTVGVAFLGVFFLDLFAKGSSAFVQTHMRLDIEFNADVIAPGGELDLVYADFDGLVRSALRADFPEVTARGARRELYRLASPSAGYQLQDMIQMDPGLLGTRQFIWVPAASTVDMYVKGNIDATLDESLRPLSDRQIAWIESMSTRGYLETQFNRALFSNGDSRDPELAGIRGALMGSFYMLIVTVVLAFPIGVAAAIYLEEFAPRNRWSDLIEVNINNLAAVPSIVFGLLGLAVFINWMAIPRSAPLVGGLVLSLLTLPVVVFHHVLPLAMPGMLTGTIIGMSRALGESAPLLMIGMVAFIVDVPGGFSDPATALPVQIYLWADSPERAFAERTSAAIIVLLGFLLLMNLAAVIIRRRMEKKW